MLEAAANVHEQQGQIPDGTPGSGGCRDDEEEQEDEEEELEGNTSSVVSVAQQLQQRLLPKPVCKNSNSKASGRCPRPLPSRTQTKMV